MDNVPAIRQGKHIGRYELKRPLGRGGMGEVWLAIDTQLRRQVAIKLLPAAMASNRAYLNDFEREARAAVLEHPHILAVHDFGEAFVAENEIVPYLVMPYIEGGTLRERIRAAHGPLPVHESLRYLRQAALAIDYAHSKGVLHRDVKPANMLLQGDWLLLADFGLAKILTGATTQEQTQAGAGTPDYMAPEQARGQAIPASDCYSLAVVAYQLFTGQQPFHGDTPIATLYRQVSEVAPPPRKFNPTIPPSVENVLLRSLAKQPEERFPTCVDFVDALLHAWMSGAAVPNDPDATLLAPWGQRWQEGSTHRYDPSLQAGQFPPGIPPVPGPQPPSQIGQVPPGISSIPGVQQSQPQMGQVSPGIPATPGVQQPTPQIWQIPGGVPPVVQNAVTPQLPPLTNPSRNVIGAPLAQPSQNFSGPAFPQAPQTSPSPFLPPSPLPGPKASQADIRRRQFLVGGITAATVLVAGGLTGAAYLYNRNNQKPAVTPPGTGSSNGTSTPGRGPKRLVAGVPVLGLTGHSSSVWTAAWDPTGRYLLTIGEDQQIMVWEIANALGNGTTAYTISKPMRMWKIAGAKLDSGGGVCWSPDGRKVIVAQTFSDKFYVLDVFGASDTPIAYSDVNTVNNGGNLSYTSACPGPGQNQFTVTTGHVAQVWNPGQTNSPANSFVYTTQSDDFLGNPAWSADGSMLASMVEGLLSSSLKFALWPNRPQQATSSVYALPQRDPHITSNTLVVTVTWSPVDPHLLLISDADVGVVWDVTKNAPLLLLGGQAPAHAPEMDGLSWSPNGRYIAGTYGVSSFVPDERPISPQILIWDIDTLRKSGASSTTVQQPVLTFGQQGFLQHTQAVTDLEWSPDGRYIATASMDGKVIIWRVDGG